MLHISRTDLQQTTNRKMHAQLQIANEADFPMSKTQKKRKEKGNLAGSYLYFAKALQFLYDQLKKKPGVHLG